MEDTYLLDHRILVLSIFDLFLELLTIKCTPAVIDILK